MREREREREREKERKREEADELGLMELKAKPIRFFFGLP